MQSYKYILEPYHGLKSRYHCPKCGKKGEFTRYIDSQTGNYLSDIVGKCNRVDHCGYHYTPSQYFIDNHIPFDTNNNKYAVRTQVRTIRTGTQSMQGTHSTQQMKQTPSFIDANIFKKSLSGYEQNIFVQYLIRLFGTDATNGLIEKYRIGTSKHWQGATIFYQIDISGKVRAGKIMLYAENGHRIKERITWVHKVLKIEPYYLKQCLFGEHLLKGNTLPVAVVESEKTAIISSIYFPKFVWVACGSKQGLSVEKCKILKGKTVFLFPDLRGFDKWQQKAKELQSLLPDVRFAVSDYLERNAPEVDRQEGYDLADYLVKFDVKDFIKPDVPMKADRLQQLIEQGNTDAALYDSGAINREQWFKRSDTLQAAILAAGLTLKEYVHTVNSLN